MNSKNLVRCAVSAALACFASGGIAGGLGIGTQSGSGTGNAFAGGAASAEDASTVWYNPAGMALLPGKTNFAIAAHALKPSFKFENAGSTVAPLAGANAEGGDGGDWAYIPQGYFSTKIGQNLSVGVAFNTPFGLKTQFDAGWRGRAIALNSELKTYNLNLAAAYKFGEMISVGGGINYQKADLKFDSQTPFGIAGPDLSDEGVGFNLGAIVQLTPGARLGVHYRSTINYQATGTIVAPALLGGTSTGAAGFTTPDSFSISAFHVLSPEWELMGDLTWTGWKHLKALAVTRTSGALAGANFTTLTFNWDDTWRASLGANYKPNDTWKFRFGVAFDQTPTNDVDRTARLPDQDRTWIAVGAQMKVFKTAKLDIGYAHEFIKDASVSNASPFGGTLRGQFNSKADIFSVQYSQSF